MAAAEHVAQGRQHLAWVSPHCSGSQSLAGSVDSRNTAWAAVQHLEYRRTTLTAVSNAAMCQSRAAMIVDHVALHDVRLQRHGPQHVSRVYPVDSSQCLCQRAVLSLLRCCLDRRHRQHAAIAEATKCNPEGCEVTGVFLVLPGRAADFLKCAAVSP